MDEEIIQIEDIKTQIHTIRGVQVMLDSDLANLYGVEVRVLNQAVKRNKERFPEDFMFQLTKEEYEALRSQIVISSWGGRRYLPYVFTEQGVAMLSAVLKSKTAVDMSIKIMKAFVAMRKFIMKNAEIFARLEKVEYKLADHDKKFDAIFNALENKEKQPTQGIFFNGQIFDAYKFVCDLIRLAQKSIILIDNYIDESVFTLLTKRNSNVKAVIYVGKITKQLELDLKKHNAQYQPVEVKELKNIHDRFLIIDNKDVYHIGASLKDLGKKVFAFSKMNKEGLKILEKVKDEGRRLNYEL
ncbi:ORF6N domain-containing protein [Deferribacterales bacterium Es71-Z0220]|jgi:hypothetical protein|uniref:ORF6N domain-containing protein n=1 Tax=Deferrivibrio essentukiensis TaxID=2880922 RepID=UPI001F61E39C|nr:ORF6N domain-containing protein [Deferrivibrio essentukiensis]MBZ4671774.1 hypothetical protein [Deferribacteraceae bacterium]MCB4204559.1 ORF6N domain-containing protein [Deferrivibrio essentukiensis]